MLYLVLVGIFSSSYETFGHVFSTNMIVGKVCLHLGLVGFIGLAIAPLAGNRLRQAIRMPRRTSGGNHQKLANQDNKKNRFVILDWFWMTAAIALAIVVFGPMKKTIGIGVILSSLPILIVSLQVVATQIVATRLILSSKMAIYWFGLGLALLASLTLVLEWLLMLTNTSAMAQFYPQVTTVRLVAMVYLLTGAWCWRLRCRLTKSIG